MKIVINSTHDDVHSLSVAWGLRKRGHEVIIRCASDYPITLGSSIAISSSGYKSFWNSAHLDTFGGVDAFWNRRLPPPTLSDDVHRSDAGFALRESTEYLKSFHILSEMDVFSINPREGRVRASSKALQLVEAAAVGLRIPETLISNEPARVFHFYKSLGGHVVHKSFSMHCWVDSRSSYSALTTVLDDSLISNAEAISLAPGIYQERIHKRYDLRVTIMGRTCFIATEHGQCSEEVDSRVDSVIGNGTGLITNDLLRKCFDLMDRLGIYFGCFDFSQGVDQGEPYFLEVNEMGQWLSYERIPGFFMLDAFCDMICSRSRDFLYDRTIPLSLHRDFLQTEEAKSLLSRSTVSSVDRQIARGVVTWDNMSA